MSYTLRKEEEEEEADGGEILGGTGYGRWGRVFLFSKSTPSCDTNTTQNCCPFLYRSNATKSEVTRFLNVLLDVSDVFFNDIHDTVGFLYGTYSRRFRCYHAFSLPAVFYQQPSPTNLSLVQSANVTLSCSASGQPAPNIEWMRTDGRSLPKSSVAVFTFGNLTVRAWG